MPGFKEELAALINKHGLDNVADTPDFILAEHLTRYVMLLTVHHHDRDNLFKRPKVEVTEL